MQLRDYQTKIIADIREEWALGAQNVMAVAPTGSGKTVIFSDILQHSQTVALAIAHRSELVGQMSLALASSGVRHNIIASKSTVSTVIRNHVQEVGGSFYSQRAPIHVASVDTLLRREVPRNVGLWVIDEGHHLLEANKWGKAVALLPQTAKGLAVTATPCRADGQGLGRHARGLVDSMVIGPGMRDLIERGFLSDYRIFCPPNDLHLEDVNTGASGEFVQKQLKIAVRRSHITGDVVAHYLKIAPGKLGITFATDVETAVEIAQQYKAAGVPAEVVSAKTPDGLRADILRRFRAREVLQLVNVDLFGEGFDVPAVEVISMARPTQSFALFSQQFGRGLRILQGKGLAIIIDHVGNVVRHGLPDAPREWTLDGRERRKRAEDAPPVRVCASCTGVFERIRKVCPYCGTVVEPPERTAPEHVDGDLTELDEATLARMRGEVARVDAEPRFPANAPPKVVGSIRKNHAERQRVQHVLRDTIAQWAGYERAKERPDDESYRRFFLTFGIDVLSAQSLGAREAGELAEKVRDKIEGY